jgi:branched-chain amino acid transport system substrate-binding protein
MQTAVDLGVTADIYLVGSCAAPAILAEAGDAADGLIFSIEGPFAGMEPAVVDGPLYFAASTLYGEDDYAPQSAGTVSFRSVMNLWMVLSDIGGDDVSPETIIDTLSAARDRPSWDGHDYTCDGEQVPGLPALCAPQQVLIRMVDGNLVLESDGWVDVSEILAGSE